jgi:2-polyprenyl-6-methoxyphenol hydroxylase-like FAD-dependent oxidoreductase
MSVSSQFPLRLQQQSAKGAPTPAGNDRILPRARVNRLLGRRAVVIGAGIGGLSAAGALAKSFDQVDVLERDDLATSARSRSGTPQDRHPHGLLAGGLRALDQISPVSRAISLPPAPSRSRLPETSNSSTRRSASCLSGISASTCSVRRGR